MKMVYCTAKRTFSYVEVPKALFTEPSLKAISADAKLLYGLMLDRMHLSKKNGWLDADGWVYIYYTLDDAMKVLGCSKGKALKVFDELEKGVELIRRTKQGTGKATVIYVKVIGDDAAARVQDVKVKAETTDLVDDGMMSRGAIDRTSSDVGESYHEEVSLDGTGADKVQKVNTAGSDFERGQVHGMNPSKLEINKPEGSNLIRSMAGTDACVKKNASWKQDAGADVEHDVVRIGSISQIDSYRNRIKTQISYEAMVARFPLEKEMLDGIVDLMLDVQLTRRESIVVAKDVRPTALVQERFQRIGSDHVEYVLDCMLRNTTKVRNIKSYLMAALYNAPSMIGSYYRAEVNHDLAG